MFLNQPPLERVDTPKTIHPHDFDCFTVVSVFPQNPVGAGRYDVQKWEEAQHRNGHSSVFKAKTGKLSPAMEKFLK